MYQTCLVRPFPPSFFTEHHFPPAIELISSVRFVLIVQQPPLPGSGAGPGGTARLQPAARAHAALKVKEVNFF